MLLQERRFYTICGIKDAEDGSHIASIRINPDCEVFKGHFPGYPVVPGVCSMETVKECAEAIIGRKTFMNNIQQCRFRNLIEPGKVENLDIKINFSDIDGGKRIVASVCKDEVTFMELKAELKYV